ncbi:hypothetical protein FIBSPDRAFT_681056, partial [Athelia psychrophila]
GLFLSTLLIKSFKQIFTSPSSAASVSVLNNHFDYEAIPSSRKKVRMRKGPPWTNIASLIGLKSLTPRAITYMAVQLWFSLSNVNSWHTNNIDFNYNKFDCTILDFFELPCGPVAKKYTDSLLATWN